MERPPQPVVVEKVREFVRETPVFNVETQVESGKFPLSTIEISPRMAPKQSPKLDMIVDWLKENPETTLSNREIAEKLGVSHTLINKAKKEFK